MTEPDFKLAKDEVYSALWMKLSAHINECLDECRKKNDGNLSPDETAKVRGRIAAYKYVLGLSEAELPAISADNGDE